MGPSPIFVHGQIWEKDSSSPSHFHSTKTIFAITLHPKTYFSFNMPPFHPSLYCSALSPLIVFHQPCALFSLAASNPLNFTYLVITGQATSLPILSSMFPAFQTHHLPSPCADLCSGYHIPSLFSGLCPTSESSSPILFLVVSKHCFVWCHTNLLDLLEHLDTLALTRPTNLAMSAR